MLIFSRNKLRFNQTASNHDNELLNSNSKRWNKNASNKSSIDAEASADIFPNKAHSEQLKENHVLHDKQDLIRKSLQKSFDFCDIDKTCPELAEALRNQKWNGKAKKRPHSAPLTLTHKSTHLLPLGLGHVPLGCGVFTKMAEHSSNDSDFQPRFARTTIAFTQMIKSRRKEHKIKMKELGISKRRTSLCKTKSTMCVQMTKNLHKVTRSLSSERIRLPQQKVGFAWPSVISSSSTAHERPINTRTVRFASSSESPVRSQSQLDFHPTGTRIQQRLKGCLRQPGKFDRLSMNDLENEADKSSTDSTSDPIPKSSTPRLFYTGENKINFTKKSITLACQSRGMEHSEKQEATHNKALSKSSVGCITDLNSKEGTVPKPFMSEKECTEEKALKLEQANLSDKPLGNSVQKVSNATQTKNAEQRDYSNIHQAQYNSPYTLYLLPHTKWNSLVREEETNGVLLISPTGASGLHGDDTDIASLQAPPELGGANFMEPPNDGDVQRLLVQALKTKANFPQTKVPVVQPVPCFQALNDCRNDLLLSVIRYLIEHCRQEPTTNASDRRNDLVEQIANELSKRRIASRHTNSTQDAKKSSQGSNEESTGSNEADESDCASSSDDTVIKKVGKLKELDRDFRACVCNPEASPTLDGGLTLPIDNIRPRLETPSVLSDGLPQTSSATISLPKSTLGGKISAANDQKIDGGILAGAKVTPCPHLLYRNIHIRDYNHSEDSITDGSSHGIQKYTTQIQAEDIRQPTCSGLDCVEERLDGTPTMANCTTLGCTTHGTGLRQLCMCAVSNPLLENQPTESDYTRRGRAEIGRKSSENEIKDKMIRGILGCWHSTDPQTLSEDAHQVFLDTLRLLIKQVDDQFTLTEVLSVLRKAFGTELDECLKHPDALNQKEKQLYRYLTYPFSEFNGKKENTSQPSVSRLTKKRWSELVALYTIFLLAHRLANNPKHLNKLRNDNPVLGYLVQDVDETALFVVPNYTSNQIENIEDPTNLYEHVRQLLYGATQTGLAPSQTLEEVSSILNEPKAASKERPQSPFPFSYTLSDESRDLTRYVPSEAWNTTTTEDDLTKLADKYQIILERIRRPTLASVLRSSEFRPSLIIRQLEAQNLLSFRPELTSKQEQESQDSVVQKYNIIKRRSKQQNSVASADSKKPVNSQADSLPKSPLLTSKESSENPSKAPPKESPQKAQKRSTSKGRHKRTKKTPKHSNQSNHTSLVHREVSTAPPYQNYEESQYTSSSCYDSALWDNLLFQTVLNKLKRLELRQMLWACCENMVNEVDSMRGESIKNISKICNATKRQKSDSKKDGMAYLQLDRNCSNHESLDRRLSEDDNSSKSRLLCILMRLTSSEVEAPATASITDEKEVLRKILSDVSRKSSDQSRRSAKSLSDLLSSSQQLGTLEDIQWFSFEGNVSESPEQIKSRATYNQEEILPGGKDEEQITCQTQFELMDEIVSGVQRNSEPPGGSFDERACKHNELVNIHAPVATETEPRSTSPQAQLKSDHIEKIAQNLTEISDETFLKDIRSGKIRCQNCGAKICQEKSAGSSLGKTLFSGSSSLKHTLPRQFIHVPKLDSKTNVERRKEEPIQQFLSYLEHLGGQNIKAPEHFKVSNEERLVSGVESKPYSIFSPSILNNAKERGALKEGSKYLKSDDDNDATLDQHSISVPEGISENKENEATKGMNGRALGSAEVVPISEQRDHKLLDKLHVDQLNIAEGPLTEKPTTRIKIEESSLSLPIRTSKEQLLDPAQPNKVIDDELTSSRSALFNSERNGRGLKGSQRNTRQVNGLSSSTRSSDGLSSTRSGVSSANSRPPRRRWPSSRPSRPTSSSDINDSKEVAKENVKELESEADVLFTRSLMYQVIEKEYNETAPQCACDPSEPHICDALRTTVGPDSVDKFAGKTDDATLERSMSQTKAGEMPADFFVYFQAGHDSHLSHESLLRKSSVLDGDQHTVDMVLPGASTTAPDALNQQGSDHYIKYSFRYSEENVSPFLQDVKNGRENSPGEVTSPSHLHISAVLENSPSANASFDLNYTISKSREQFQRNEGESGYRTPGQPSVGLSDIHANFETKYEHTPNYSAVCEEGTTVIDPISQPFYELPPGPDNKIETKSKVKMAYEETHISSMPESHDLLDPHIDRSSHVPVVVSPEINGPDALTIGNVDIRKTTPALFQRLSNLGLAGTKQVNIPTANEDAKSPTVTEKIFIEKSEFRLPSDIPLDKLARLHGHVIPPLVTSWLRCKPGKNTATTNAVRPNSAPTTHPLGAWPWPVESSCACLLPHFSELPRASRISPVITESDRSDQDLPQQACDNQTCRIKNDAVEVKRTQEDTKGYRETTHYVTEAVSVNWKAVEKLKNKTTTPKPTSPNSVPSAPSYSDETNTQNNAAFSNKLLHVRSKTVNIKSYPEYDKSPPLHGSNSGKTKSRNIRKIKPSVNPKRAPCSVSGQEKFTRSSKPSLRR